MIAIYKSFAPRRYEPKTQDAHRIELTNAIEFVRSIDAIHQAVAFHGKGETLSDPTLQLVWETPYWKMQSIQELAIRIMLVNTQKKTRLLLLPFYNYSRHAHKHVNTGQSHATQIILTQELLDTHTLSTDAHFVLLMQDPYLTKIDVQKVVLGITLHKWH